MGEIPTIDTKSPIGDVPPLGETPQMGATPTSNNTVQENTKFCKHCGGKIAQDCVICILCGKQVEVLKAEQPNVVINNANNNNNANFNANSFNAMGGRLKNKWVALLLCFFLGVLGAHKFYEGKIGMGVLYLFTWGLLGIGVFVDFITLLFKPNPYI